MIRSHTGTPASYLAQFARVQEPTDRKAKVWVYQKGLAPFTAPPARVGWVKGYFAIIDGHGRCDESLEDSLAGSHDCEISLIRNLTRETYVAGVRDSEKLAWYVAAMFARTTARQNGSARLQKEIHDAYKELTREAAWQEQQVAFIEQFGRSGTPAEIEKIAAKVLEKFEKPEQVKNGFVQSVIPIAEGIFNLLVGKPWQIWEAPESNEFITTDNPVITFAPNGMGSFSDGCGFSTPGVITMLTISPQHCLVIGVAEPRWRRAQAQWVSELNKALVMNMDRFAYSAFRSDALAELVNQIGGCKRYFDDSFVPTWIGNRREYLKTKIAELTRSKKIAPQVTKEARHTERNAG